MIIRRAIESDLPAILAIYNHEIETSTAIYLDEPQTLGQRAEWFAGRQAAGFPIFVLEDETGVAAFGTYGPFRHYPGYRFCVEHSLYVAESRRRRGYGAQMLATLIDAATKQGMHTMVAAIDTENEHSLDLHRAAGFTPVGHLKEIACKFGRWLDLVLLQKNLDSRLCPPL
jgi:L-amino acid N-acyltransferase YncA